MEFRDIISRLAYRRIVNFSYTSKTPIEILILFEDNVEVKYTMSVHLLIFAVLIQDIQYEPIVGNTDHCVRLPLLFFNLLGFRSGDAFLFRNSNGMEQSILFS